MPLFTEAPNSICILRLSAIGDVCHAIACVQSIQRQWPETSITWVCGTIEAQLLHHINNVNVISFDKKSGVKAYLALYRQLKNKKFDALLHMQAALRASVASLMIKAKYKLGFDKARAKDFQWLFTNQKINMPISEHVLDGFMAFAQKLGVQDLKVEWNLNIPSHCKERAKGLIQSKPTFLICPAASKVYKNWTINGYIEIAKYAIKKGFQVFICGSPSLLEKEIAQKITNETNQQSINLIGKTSLIELLALIEEANLILAPDTGPTHMATMVNTPAIGLYAHHNPKRTGPYHQLKNVISVYEEGITKQTGKPLEQLPWRARVKDEHAMQNITIDNVIALFNKIIKT